MSDEIAMYIRITYRQEVVFYFLQIEKEGRCFEKKSARLQTCGKVRTVKQ